MVGRVWDDRDADGILDPNERGIEGAEVQLENKHGKKLLEVNTDANGWYSIDGRSIIPGEYIVDFVRPDTPDPAYQISPKHGDQMPSVSRADPLNGKTEAFMMTAGAANGQRENVNLSAGFFRSATVSGYVWHDLNRDSHGQFNDKLLQVVNTGGEFGLEDFRVRLLDETGREVGRSRTDRYGRYTLAVPTPGKYYVDFEESEGLQFSDRGGNSFVNPDSGRSNLLQINALQQVTRMSAGLYSDAGTETLRGRVWHDIDADGFQDPDETGVANAEVQLENASLVQLLDLKTNGAGDFVIDGRSLLPGQYHLDFKRPSRNEAQGKWQISPRNENAVDESLDNDAQPTNGKTSPIQLTVHTLGHERRALERDAAFFQFAKVTGKAWNDVNRDGALSDGESLTPGVEVELLDEAQQTVTTAITNASGEYIMEQLIPGETYSVQFKPPQDTNFASDAVAPELPIDPGTGRSLRFVPKSDEVIRVGTGLYGASNNTALAGIAWDDIDGDGVRGVDEPGRANVEVRLLGFFGEPISTTITEPDGTYRFADIAPGGYRLEFIPPDAGTISPMQRGDDASRDSDVNRFTRRTAIIPIVGNQVDSSFDVGIYSGPISEDVTGSLRITEVGFIGHGSAEFLEVKNIGAEPIDLTDTAFTSGIRFDFSDSATKSLFPNEHAVIVGDRALLPNRDNGLANRFSLADINVAGVYRGDLNREENITLLDGDDVVTSFRYDDDWFIIMDDEYQAWTLTVVDQRADVSAWDSRNNWRPSSFLAGTPGVDDPKTTPDPGAIVVNEVLTQSADGFNDLIEIHNTTDSDIDIGYWYLGDSGRRGEVEPLIKRTRYRIAPGTIVPANGYVVFSREEHFSNADDPGLNYPFGLSSFGEAVHIIAADKYGHMMGYSDSVSFPSADRDMSFGRHVLSDGTATFTVMSEPSFGNANPAPLIGPVLIDAFAYHTDESAEEFVRLFNRSENDIQLSSPAGFWQLGAGIEYRFSDEAMIRSGQRALVVGIEPGDFREKYAVPVNIPIFGPYDGSLNNAGESITLLRPGPEGRTLLVDRVTYDDEQPWPVPGDGNSALLRARNDILGEEPTNWVLSGEPTVGNSTDGLYRRQFMQTASADFFGHDSLGQYAFQAEAGDSNGDGRFDSSDLVMGFRAGKYDTGNPADWSQGDWNSDGLFDSSDLVLAFMKGHYERENPAAIAAAVADHPLRDDLVDAVFG